MLEKKIKIFRKKGQYENEIKQNEFVRPYVNSVTIKLIKDKSYLHQSVISDNFLQKNSNFDVFEQAFRITSKTTFDQLKEGA